VTGASSGIGDQLARQLAACGASLVITARRSERLEALAADLRREHGVSVTVIPLDLAEPAAPQQLWDETEGAGQPIDILINNAGFGTLRPLADISWEGTRSQLQVNVVALTELTSRFVKAMRRRGAGYILNVASIGAYLPCPGFATYAAAKAYVRNFTEALAAELKGTGVRACCLCPGGTATEFLQVSGQRSGGLAGAMMMSAERCARIGLRALLRGRRNIVSGWLNSLGMWLLRFVPRRLMPWLAALILQPAEELRDAD